MHHSLENELLAFLNDVHHLYRIVEAFRFGDETPVDPQLATRIIIVRNSPSEQRFNSLEQFESMLGLDHELILRLVEAMSQSTDCPVLLLPIRIETRFLENDLWVRIYPDQVLIDVHDPRLTQEELDAIKSYFPQLIDPQGNTNDDIGADVWRGLAQQFGPERAAWIVTTLRDAVPDDLRGEPVHALAEYVDAPGLRIFPTFRATLPPDLTFFGFPFDETAARGIGDDLGKYFILEQRVTEPRFGLDVPTAAQSETDDDDGGLDSWDDLSWSHFELGQDDDVGKYLDEAPASEPVFSFAHDGKSWQESTRSATRASITLQKPVRIALHARHLIPVETEYRKDFGSGKK